MQGSHFGEEHYYFSEDCDNLSEFTEMLKNRGYYIGEDNHIRTPKGVLASKLMRNGYYLTSAQYNNKIFYFMEHRVIWCWCNGVIPRGMVINHKDYNRANNAIDNLEVLTQKDNTEYSRCHLNPQIGEKNVKAGLTDKQAQAIKTLSNICGWGPKMVERLTNVKQTTVTKIAHGYRYPNVIEAESIMSVYPILVDFTRNKTIGPEEEIKNYLLGLNGECGEATDMIKKVLYHGKDFEPVSFMLELGDILYYLTAICNVLGIDLSEVMMNNNSKLLARYKDGYSVEQSLNRIEDKTHQ